MKDLSDDDCSRPACDDIKSMFQKAKAHVTTKNTTTSTPEPPTKGQIGKAGWTLLHSMAAWYPDQPSSDDESSMRNFLHAFARFYPCTYCAKDFQANLQAKPPQTKTRKQLCQWLCDQHNMVNEKLGKSKYPCDMETLDKRWREAAKQPGK